MLRVTISGHIVKLVVVAMVAMVVKAKDGAGLSRAVAAEQPVRLIPFI